MSPRIEHKIETTHIKSAHEWHATFSFATPCVGIGNTENEAILCLFNEVRKNPERAVKNYNRIAQTNVDDRAPHIRWEFVEMRDEIFLKLP